MGTTIIYGASKEDIIFERTDGNPRQKCIRHEVTEDDVDGIVLWTVWETVSGRFIGCDLLIEDADGWGYKNMYEEMHPFYYSCPLEFLDLVPDSSEYANLEWRAIVRGEQTHEHWSNQHWG